VQAQPNPGWSSVPPAAAAAPSSPDSALASAHPAASGHAADATATHPANAAARPDVDGGPHDTAPTIVCYTPRTTNRTDGAQREACTQWQG